MWEITESSNREGHFIAIEGIDSSGKKTQAKKLIEKLKEDHDRVKYVEFPTYGDTEFGELVSRFLRGEFGDRDEVPIEIISILYALDRYQFKREFKNFLSEGGIIVANRYTQSNLAFQTAELGGENWEETVDWIKKMEERLPQPDQVVILDIDPVKARKLMDQKSLRDYLNGEKLDINEEKMHFQSKVADNYLKLAERFGWDVISCIEGGKLRSIQEINDELYKTVSLKLNL